MLNTLVNFKQLQNQTEQIQQQARGQAIQGVSTFMNLARNTADPTQLTQLVNRFSQLGVGTTDELLGILNHVTPTEDALKSYYATLGGQVEAGHTPEGTTDASKRTAGEALSSVTSGMNQGQAAASGFLSSVFAGANPNTPGLAEGLASRTATGMTPGERAVDTAQAGLPAAELAQQGGIKGGTRMTAAQDAGNQLGFAQLRANVRSDEVRNAQRDVELGISKEQVDAAMKKATAQGLDPQKVTNLLEAKKGVLGLIQSRKNANPSKQELLGYIGTLNGLNAALTALGLPNEGQLEYNPDILLEPGFFDRKFKTPVTSTPVNVVPPGTGRR
jgi:hypothetical protein